MLKSNVGSSIESSAFEAGKQAGLKAKNGLEAPKMAFVYGSCDYDLDAMLKGVSEALPGVPLIGNTSYTGVITPEGYISGPDGFVGVMALDDPEYTVGTAISARTQDCPETIGEKLAKEAMAAAGKQCAPDYFYMVASPAEEEHYLKGITKVIGRVPFFGGSCADNEIAGKWSLYTDKLICADGCAVAFFYTDKPFANKFTGAYNKTGDMGIVTKMNGDRNLCEIDGVPALKKYAQWAKTPVEELKGGALLAASVTSPLGVSDRLGDLIAIRHPMNGNDDNTINVGNKIAEGTAIIRMEATVDQLIDSTGKTLAETRKKLGTAPGAFHLVHCGGRRAGIAGRIDEVAKQLIAQADGVPFIAEFTFGEYGYERDGMNTCGGLMLSFTALGK